MSEMPLPSHSTDALIQKFTGENILMTVGAAGGLNVIFKTLLNPGG